MISTKSLPLLTILIEKKKIFFPIIAAMISNNEAKRISVEEDSCQYFYQTGITSEENRQLN